MRKIRRSKERGHANHGWLDSYHTFSFADYYDPSQMGFRVLRVINEDEIEGGAGFATHAHKDMEIITYVYEGALEHRDSMDNSAVIRPGEVQRMSAGTGVKHSEYNHLSNARTRLLQIWIMPDRYGYHPSYDQKDFSDAVKAKDLVLVASKTARDGSIGMNQNVDMYVAKPKNGSKIPFSIRPDRHLWIQLVKGKLDLEQDSLLPGDGIAISDENEIVIDVVEDSEFIVFDLP